MKNFFSTLALFCFLNMSVSAEGGLRNDNNDFDFSIESLDRGYAITADANSMFEYISESSPKHFDLAQSADQSIQFNLNKTEAESIFNYSTAEITIDNFRLPGGSNVKLILTKGDPIYDANTAFIANGKRIKMPIIDSYHGHIDGKPNSSVYLTEYKGALTGAIYTEESNYDIGKIFAQEENGNQHIIKQSKVNIDANSGFTFCGVQEEDFENFDLPNPSDKELDNAKNANGLLELRLTSVGTWDYLKRVAAREGSLAANASVDDYVAWESSAESAPIFERAVVYMAQVLDMTSRIYEKQVNLKFSVDSIVQFGSNDPMIDIQLKGNRKDASVKLNRMPAIWDDRTDDSHFVVMFNNSTADNGSNILGIAMGGLPGIGNFCNRGRGYCVVGVAYDYIQPTFEGSGDVHTTAHELGHLFGSPHTHNRYWFAPSSGEPNYPHDDQPDVRDTCVTTTSPPPGTGDAKITNPSLRRPRQDGTLMSYCHIGGKVVSRFHPYIATNILRKGAALAQCVGNPDEKTVRLTSMLGERVLSTNFEPITWRSHNITQVDIAYSIDGGDFQTIATGVNASDGSYNWDLPNESTENMIVEIYEAGNRNPESAAYDKSLRPLIVQNRFIAITEPTDGNKIGQTIDYIIKWEDNLVDDFSVEYSLEGSNNWIAIDNTANNFAVWDAPDDYIGNVQIRVSDVVVSTLFDVVTIELGPEDGEIISPSSGMTLCEGSRNVEIEFQSDFVEKVTFEYSINGGDTYRNVRPVGEEIINAEETDKYVWPDLVTQGAQNNYKLRMLGVNPEGANIVLDEVTLNVQTSPDCVPSSVETDVVSLIDIGLIAPNPAQNSFAVHYSLIDGIGKTIIDVIDLNGRTVLSKLVPPKVGNNIVKFDINTLPQGSYRVVIKNGIHTATQQMMIKR